MTYGSPSEASDNGADITWKCKWGAGEGCFFGHADNINHEENRERVAEAIAAAATRRQ